MAEQKKSIKKSTLPENLTLKELIKIFREETKARLQDDQYLQNKLSDWLTKEKFQFSLKEDDKAVFHILISNAYGLKFTVDIIKPKESPFVQIAMGSRMSSEIIQAYSSLKEKERLRFIGGIQRELLKFNVEHGLLPSKLQLDSIVISKNVYIEDLTRTLFMNSTFEVKYAMLYAVWSISQKFSGDNVQTTSQPPNSSSPYG